MLIFNWLYIVKYKNDLSAATNLTKSNMKIIMVVWVTLAWKFALVYFVPLKTHWPKQERSIALLVSSMTYCRNRKWQRESAKMWDLNIVIVEYRYPEYTQRTRTAFDKNLAVLQPKSFDPSRPRRKPIPGIFLCLPIACLVLLRLGGANGLVR